MKIRFFLSLLALLLGLNAPLQAQAPPTWSATDIYNGLQELNFLGSALYLAAHPDDENTQLIAYLANVTHARTAYLSLTRGDGGQNLIGPEMRELLGIIRTQELLAARRIDGGEQFFTRANDFGYSKHPDETFNIWDREDVLADVVWTIRRFQPDIILNRFDHRRAGETHGHHTASAILALEAYELAADPEAFPEQLAHVDTWQPRRVYYNTSWWRYGSREAFEAVDKSNMVKVDVGQYLPLRGTSPAEIAARSRSQHKSQGFGSSPRRGAEWEYLEVVKGDVPSENDLFAGINTSWSRVEGGETIGQLLDQVIERFDFNDPTVQLPAILDIKERIEALPDSHWKRVKSAQINEIIQGMLGLFVEVLANDPTATPGQQINLEATTINRANVAVVLQHYGIAESKEGVTELGQFLEENEPFGIERPLELPGDLPFTNAYWLNEPATLGMYAVEDQRLRGLPESPRGLHLTFQFSIRNEVTEEWHTLEVTRPLVYKTTDPVRGEVYRPFEITPSLFVDLDKSTYIFADGEPRTVTVTVAAGAPNQQGRVELCHPEGWSAEPAHVDFQLENKGDEVNIPFLLTPPAGQSVGEIVPLARIGEETFTRQRTLIEYDHFPPQTILQDASSQVVRINLEKRGDNIGYLMGAGDDIPTALEEIGYRVTLLEDRDFTPERLAEFDAIIIGIRAYNTVERMPVYQPLLMDYVKSGGAMVVQYNTTRGLQMPSEELGPYPLRLSRDRVTVEEAEVRFLAPDHPVLNTPNKITEADFENWVQERGLYFPDEWDEAYTPILSSNDPGEPARDGGLLVAKYGEGYYVYSGYSWFRELPAGVPGAYRLFANLISLGRE